MKLVDGIRQQLAALARIRGTTAEALEAEQHAKIASGELPPRDVSTEAGDGVAHSPPAGIKAALLELV